MITRFQSERRERRHANWSKLFSIPTTSPESAEQQHDREQDLATG